MGILLSEQIQPLARRCHPEAVTHSSSAPSSGLSFAHTVLANVLAILMAAGILYFLAAAAGYLEAKPVVTGFVLALLVAAVPPITVQALTARRTQ